MSEQFVQPDNRISENQLGTWEFSGKRFVIHNMPGCPKNAVVEVNDSTFPPHLQCWSCRRALTPDAAQYVTDTYKITDKGTFIVP